MKNFALLFSLYGVMAGCGSSQINDLPLVWAGVGKTPPPSAAVGAALGTIAIEPGDFKDGRTTPPNVVGTFKDDGFKVTTKGDVRAFWAGRERTLLEAAGARFQTPGGARLDATLLQLDVLEDNMFNGTARMTFTVTTRSAQPWSRSYDGHSKRWGRTHKPDNFDEALSSAIADATRQLLHDDAFAAALQGQPTQ